MAGMPMDNGILQSVDPLPNIGITPVFLKIIPSARFCSSVIFFLSTCPIEGGTSVNTIAQDVKILYEYRSDRMMGLELMEREMSVIVDKYTDRRCQSGY